MSSPYVRGLAKESYNVDALKAPNRSGALCRGEPADKVTTVGSSVTLGFTITAPHVGMCTVYILDADLTNSRQIAQKLDCAAPGKVGPWTITIPSDITGRKVIRWYWQATHVTPSEPYENCADVMIGGGSGGGYGNTPAPESTSTATPGYGSGSNPTGTASAPSSAPTTTYPSAPATPATPATPAAPSSNKSDGDDGGDDGNYPSSTAPSTGGSYGSGSSPSPSYGSACQPNQYTCGPDGQLGQCNFGKYVWFKCATGTTCRSSGSSIYCGY